MMVDPLDKLESKKYNMEGDILHRTIKVYYT